MRKVTDFKLISEGVRVALGQMQCYRSAIVLQSFLIFQGLTPITVFYFGAMFRELLQKLYKRTHFRLMKFLLLFKHFDPSEAILIFSEPRSGSTWLMHTLASILDVCIIWEPFHQLRGVGFQGEYPLRDTAVVASDQVQAFTDYINDVHTNRSHSKWSLKYCTPGSIIRAKSTLVKYVRANLLMPFIIRTVPHKYTSIWLIRHPVESTLSHFTEFGEPAYLSSSTQFPKWMLESQFSSDLEYVSRLETSIEKAVAILCVKMITTISAVRKSEVQIVYYEELIARPDLIIDRILNEWGLPKYSSRIDKLDFARPSQSDFQGRYMRDRSKQISKYSDQLSEEMKTRIQAIFDHYEFDLYSAYSPHPNQDFARRFGM